MSNSVTGEALTVKSLRAAIVELETQAANGVPIFLDPHETWYWVPPPPTGYKWAVDERGPYLIPL